MVELSRLLSRNWRSWRGGEKSKKTGDVEERNWRIPFLFFGGEVGEGDQEKKKFGGEVWKRSWLKTPKNKKLISINNWRKFGEEVENSFTLLLLLFLLAFGLVRLCSSRTRRHSSYFTLLLRLLLLFFLLPPSPLSSFLQSRNCTQICRKTSLKTKKKTEDEELTTLWTQRWWIHFPASQPAKPF